MPQVAVGNRRGRHDDDDVAQRAKPDALVGGTAADAVATALHGGALGVLISLAREPWYASHAARTLAAGGDAVLDQQLAGLIMWVIAGTLLTAVGLALFTAWLGQASRSQRRSAVAQLIAAQPHGAEPPQASEVRP